MIRFVVVLVIAAIAVGILSLLWPRFSAGPRPAPLAVVHSSLMGTPLGQNAAAVLGVSDESRVTPINTSTIIGDIAGSAVTLVQKRAETVIMKQTIRELTNKFNDLSPEEQQEIRQSICQPK